MPEIQMFKIAVSAFVVNQNKILLLKRSNNESFLPGKWEVPGGGVDVGESLEQGVMREVKEEAGIEVIIKDLFGYFEFVDGKGRHTVNLNFLCTVDAEHGDVDVALGEMQEARWVELEDFDDVDFTSRNMSDACKRALEIG
ncbi:MAG: NUDIX hydrolase [Patescibacteria group bacterium]|nr:NUDIX hydrolase [Patescibacteria group bacterium]